jgi:hypothetical protein
VHLVCLLVGECSLQTAVVDPVANALSARLGVRKLIDKAHIFDEITTNLTCNLHNVVLMERKGRRWYGWGYDTSAGLGGRLLHRVQWMDRRCATSSARSAAQPETDVLEASRVLAERHEARDGSAFVELRQETFIFRPEEADVRNRVEQHGNTLEAYTKSPSHAVRYRRIIENRLGDDTGSQDFKPVALPENLKLPTRRGEGEVRLYPAYFQGLVLSLCRCVRGRLGCVEYGDYHVFEAALEVGGNRFDFLG